MSAPSELVSELFHASQRACRLNCNEGMREKIYGGKINFFFFFLELLNYVADKAPLNCRYLPVTDLMSAYGPLYFTW